MIAMIIICAVELLLIVALCRCCHNLEIDRNKYRRDCRKKEGQISNLKSENLNLSENLRRTENQNKKLIDDLLFLRLLCASVDICSRTGASIKFRRRINGEIGNDF